MSPEQAFRIPEAGEPPPKSHDQADLAAAVKGGGFQDKKKVLILGVLLLVGVAVVGYQFLGGQGPKKAAAVTMAPSSTTPASVMHSEVESVLARLEGQSAGPEAQDLSVLRVEQLVKQFDGYIRERQLPLAALATNPFKLKLSPTVVVREQQIKEDQEAAAASEALRTQQLRDAASQLTLGSVLVGPSKRMAVINGEVYELGERVAGFTVTDIQPEQVQLEANGIEVDLEIVRKYRIAP